MVLEEVPLRSARHQKTIRENARFVRLSGYTRDAAEEGLRSVTSWLTRDTKVDWSTKPRQEELKSFLARGHKGWVTALSKPTGEELTTADSEDCKRFVESNFHIIKVLHGLLPFDKPSHQRIASMASTEKKRVTTKDVTRVVKRLLEDPEFDTLLRERLRIKVQQPRLKADYMIHFKAMLESKK